MQLNKIIKYLTLTTFFAFSTFVYANQSLNEQLLNGEIITSLKRADKAKLIIGHVTAVVNASPEKVFEIMSNPDYFLKYNGKITINKPLLYSDFSKFIESKNKLDEKEQQNILINLTPNLTKKKCNTIIEETSYYFYRNMNLPWPLADKWFVSKENYFCTNKNLSKFCIVSERLLGSMKVCNVKWEITRFNNLTNKTLLNMRSKINIGINPPDFLLSLGKNGELPDAIKAIRELVR